jgi:hypothetical protein
MRKLILWWLFGTDDIDSYMQLLRENIGHCDDGIKHTQECIDLINEHKRTLDKRTEDIDIIRKLIKICENHDIDVDEEIKHIELDEV